MHFYIEEIEGIVELQTFLTVMPSIKLSAPASPFQNEGCLFTQQRSSIVRKRFFRRKRYIFRHGKVMNAPGELNVKWVWWFALSMLGSFSLYYGKNRGKNQGSKVMTWPERIATWPLILRGQKRTKNGLKDGESCSGNDLSIWSCGDWWKDMTFLE